MRILEGQQLFFYFIQNANIETFMSKSIWIYPKKPRLHIGMTKFDKVIARFSELSPNLSNKQRFFAQQNVLQNLRHESVDFQFKIVLGA